MSEEIKLSKVEHTKEQSNYLRGTILEDLASDEASISEDNGNLLKFHGSYQQDNRDLRAGGNKTYGFMIRTRIPGGHLNAEQMLAHLDLCDELGNRVLRITDRQGFQLHGVPKTDLKSAIRAINHCKLTTIAACGDIVRNVVACPAPYKHRPVYEQLRQMTQALTMHFRPTSTSYFEVWLKDGENSELIESVSDEPIYGKTYLPRKFKFGLVLPEDNCIDVYTQDVGLIAVVENDNIVGYNFLVGGSMGVTPAKKDTFPAVGKRLCYVPVDQVLAVAEAIVKVQRDHGNRSERKLARMKYVVNSWGIEKFKAKVEEYYGAPLADPHPTDVTGVDDHLGWHEQGDGKLFLGINVQNGRIEDKQGGVQLKAFFRELLARFPQPLRLTALQSVLVCDLDPKDKNEVEAIMRRHGVLKAEEWSLTRRYSIACPALPMCGLAVTESERILPSIIDELDVAMEQIGLKEERITLHMTGCPNGCARPYVPEIGIVGKAKGKYTLFLGGSPLGTRINFMFKDMIPQEELIPVLTPLLIQWRDTRQEGEAFGDFCFRLGKENLIVEEAAVSAS
ncbi:MAG TPA: NADPH-dependent assimilatory sulfite reductase hemoprotein subunit [Planctomicrobium sp.]|nr:NADPH-dependent assimilatory sulfite reductase hemoprotein subunit [Planctomicrobium sp.]